MNGPALVAFFGSTRKGSYNAAVLRVAIEAARELKPREAARTENQLARPSIPGLMAG